MATRRRTATSDGKRTLFFQHDTEWIEPGLRGEGNILVFSNGAPKVREFSSVEEIVPELDENDDYVRDPDGGFSAAVEARLPAAVERRRGRVRGDRVERAALAQRQHADRLRTAGPRARGDAHGARWCGTS